MLYIFTLQLGVTSLVFFYLSFENLMTCGRKAAEAHMMRNYVVVGEVTAPDARCEAVTKVVPS